MDKNEIALELTLGLLKKELINFEGAKSEDTVSGFNKRISDTLVEVYKSILDSLPG